MVNQTTGERILSMVFILLGVGAVIHAFSLGVLLNDEDMGVGLFPFIVGAGIVICGLGQLATASKAKPFYQCLSREQTQRVLRVFAGMVVYIFSMNYLGYLVATFLFVVYLTRLLGAAQWKNVFGIALAVAFSFSLVFQQWMQMPLPVGWFDILGMVM